MASPQIENGYVRIASELLAAVLRSKLSGSEFRIMMAVAVKTYGWNKKEDQISISQLMGMTGLTRSTVCKVTKSLVSKRTLGRVQSDTTISSTYWIQKDYEKWLGSVQNGTSVRLDTRGSVQNGKKVVSKMVPTIDNITIDNIKTCRFDFESLWSRYPNKDGKQDAERHFNKTVKTEEDFQNIQKALTNYLGSKRVQGGYIKNGSTWFNNWRDWITYVEPVAVVSEQEKLMREAGLINDPNKSRRRSLEE